MATQYLKVSLGGPRLYTYVNDQPQEVHVGDQVEVTTPNGATIKGTVEEITDPPSFPCKPCFKV